MSEIFEAEKAFKSHIVRHHFGNYDEWQRNDSEGCEEKVHRQACNWNPSEAIQVESMCVEIGVRCQDAEEK